MLDALARTVDIDEAAELLLGGDVCAFPTETVYGLGADAGNVDAVLKVFEAKGRPRFNPLIVHCADREMAEQLGYFDPISIRLAERFWPGPMTLAVPIRPDAPVCDLVTAGLGTVGLRVPANALAHELLARVGKPVAAPSANRSGHLSPTSAEHVLSSFEGRIPVLDGGSCAGGLESTILTVVNGQIIQLRPGAVARDEVAAATGMTPLVAASGGKLQAPGMLASHYAPDAEIRLNADGPNEGEAWLGFGEANQIFEQSGRNLSPTGDLREAAKNLFGYLHALDRTGVKSIAVAPIPEEGLGEAINDRLRRAAAPRDQSRTS